MAPSTYTASATSTKKPFLHYLDSTFSSHGSYAPVSQTPFSSPTSASGFLTSSPTSSSSSGTTPTGSEGTTHPTTLFARMRPSRSRSQSQASSTSGSSSTSSSTQVSPRHSLHQRTESWQSSSAASASASASTRTRSRSNAFSTPPSKRNSGTTMQVGRHGNDWLFGGFSFTGTVKGLLSPTGSEDASDGERKW
ncbi:hypothetical protein MMC09_002132 [Bachmanniomyces sp. S44760]|nr:hypothetical protein [Bachmanniomyces sp. S44760]